MIAAGIPDKGNTPTVTHVAITTTIGGIQISWTAPDSNYGTIDEYKVTIADENSLYVEPST